MAKSTSKERLGKAALAKANNISFTVEGVYEDDRQKFQAMAQDLGITFDGNNNVLDNDIKDDVADNTLDISGLETSMNDAEDDIELLQAKVASIATLFNIVFNSAGTITSEEYISHNHDYEDGTINDTDDGTGTQTDTTRTTTGVI